MKILLGTALIAFLLGADLLLGNIAVALGLAVYGSLYLAGACGRSVGVTAALISGVVLDAVYNRPFCISVFIFSAAVFAGMLAAERVHFRTPEASLFAGGATGIVFSTGGELAASLFACPAPGPDWLSSLIFNTVFGMIFMLFLVALLDFAAGCAGLPRFEQELLERSPRSRRFISRSALRGDQR